LYHSLAASRRPRDAESVLQAKPRHWRDKLFTAVEEFTNEIRTASRQLKVLLKLFQKLAGSRDGVTRGF